MDAKEVVRRALQIERANADGNHENLLTLLSDLDNVQVTAVQLKTTDLVKVLYKLLRTCSNEGVKKTAKGLLSKWKRQYRRDPEVSPGVSLPGKTKDVSQHTKSQTVQCGGKVEEGVKHPEQEASCLEDKDGPQTVSFSTDSTSASCSFSSVRSKCVELLLAALSPDSPEGGKAAELAAEIETHIHGRHAKSSQAKYKACVRSKVANLRNPKSEHLRRGLLGGSLSPEAFAGMSAEEMAGAELRRLREEYSCRGVSERQLPRGVEGTRTQKISCKRCGGRDCRVTQVSRGALFLPAWVRQGGPDEDAMTFVTCGGCGQQWYHSGWVCL